MTDALPSIADTALTMNPTPFLSAKIGSSMNIDKTAQDFESLFATQMLQPMFETVGVDASFGGGHGEEVMRSFLVQEYGKIIAKSGKLGIASQVKAEMLRAQEGENARGTASLRTTSNAYTTQPSQGATYVAN